MMEKIEKYANLYELPRKLEESVKLFYTFQHKKKLDSSETVRMGKGLMIHGRSLHDIFSLVLYCTDHEYHTQNVEDEDYGKLYPLLLK